MATPQENTAIIQGLYSNYQNGRIDQLFELLADDVCMACSGPAEKLSFAGEYHGHDGVRRYLQALAADWAIERYDVLEYIAEGDKVVARANVTATNRRTNKPVTIDKADFWTLRGGKVVAFREILDTAAAEHASD